MERLAHVLGLVPFNSLAKFGTVLFWCQDIKIQP